MINGFFGIVDRREQYRDRLRAGGYITRPEHRTRMLHGIALKLAIRFRQPLNNVKPVELVAEHAA